MQGPKGLYVNLTGTDIQRLSDLLSPEPVAQLVEHRTFNAVVAGSSPARLTKIIDFQWFAGSVPRRGTSHSCAECPLMRKPPD
jgi:hypothetical protein